MKSTSGTYALILEAKETSQIQIGRWGILDIKIGYYIYIGSAFGPGGVRARVSRHFRAKKHHWHIDYLTEHISLQEAWLSHSKDKLEHIWAKDLLKNKQFSPIKGFGCSDCKCFSHLFYSNTKPNYKEFSKSANTKNETIDLYRPL